MTATTTATLAKRKSKANCWIVPLLYIYLHKQTNRRASPPHAGRETKGLKTSRCPSKQSADRVVRLAGFCSAGRCLGSAAATMEKQPQRWCVASKARSRQVLGLLCCDREGTTAEVVCHRRSAELHRPWQVRCLRRGDHCGTTAEVVCRPRSDGLLRHRELLGLRLRDYESSNCRGGV